MAVLKNVDGTELLVDCHCGCNEGIRLKIEKDSHVDDWFCFLTYTNGAFYKEQGETIFGVLGKKLKKIWAIIRNKDFYYADITMTRDEFQVFREWISNVDIGEV